MRVIFSVFWGSSDKTSYFNADFGGLSGNQVFAGSKRKRAVKNCEKTQG